MILVAGIGNIFLGDDAFGVEVVHRLAQRPLPEGVRVVDFGIRGLDLVYTLLDDLDAVFLVDAMPRGGTAGTLYVLEPNDDAAGGPVSLEMHDMDPARVLRLVAALGGRVKNLVVVGCEPQAPAAGNGFAMEMSVPVRDAVDEAVKLIESLIMNRLTNEEGQIPVREVHKCHPWNPTT
jgi:hydrogenase maturation protease